MTLPWGFAPTISSLEQSQSGAFSLHCCTLAQHNLSQEAFPDLPGLLPHLVCFLSTLSLPELSRCLSLVTDHKVLGTESHPVPPGAWCIVLFHTDCHLILSRSR